MSKKISLIFGAAGQDGSLMTRYLLKKNYNVYALSQSKNNSLIDIKKKDNLKILKINYYNFSQIKKIIIKSKCSEIYFFSGKSSPQFSFLNYHETLNSHIIPVYNILQNINEINKKIKFFNTSSSEIFEKSKKKLNEKSDKNPQNPYGLAKLDSLLLVKFYRKNFKLNCFSGILFNHESNLRPKYFFISKIINYIKKKKFNDKLKLGDLSVIKDFGWAEDYIEIIHQLVIRRKYEDYIIATGKSYKLKNVVKKIFEFYDLNWKKYVVTDKKLSRPSENKIIYANITKIEKLNLKPKKNLPYIIKELCKN